MTDILLVYITTPNKAEAKRIASELIKIKLAACANILDNVASIFYWGGELKEENECLLLLKTTKNKFPALMQKAKQLHSYELPCIVALPLADGLPAYLTWVEDETTA